MCYEGSPETVGRDDSYLNQLRGLSSAASHFREVLNRAAHDP